MIDLNELSAAQLKKIERALKPYSQVFSRRFVARDIAAWRACAELNGKSTTVWIAEQLNVAAAKQQELGPNKRRPNDDANARDTVLSLRFSPDDIALWKNCADDLDESDTEWVERQLRAAVDHHFKSITDPHIRQQYEAAIDQRTEELLEKGKKKK